MKLLIHSQTSTSVPLKCGNGWTISSHTWKLMPKANWQWGRVGWMLAGHRDGLSVQVFRLILDISVGFSAGVQFAGDLVSERPLVRILHSAEEDNLSPFDSNIACLCQSIEINNNKHLYWDLIKTMSVKRTPWTTHLIKSLRLMATVATTRCALCK